MNTKIENILFDAEKEVALMQIEMMLRKKSSYYVVRQCKRFREVLTDPPPTHPMLEEFEYHRDKVLDDIWNKLNYYDTELLEEFLETMSPEGLEVFCRMERPRLSANR